MVWSHVRYSTTSLKYLTASGKCVPDAASSLKYQPIFLPQTPSSNLSTLPFTHDHIHSLLLLDYSNTLTAFNFVQYYLPLHSYLSLLISRYNVYQECFMCPQTIILFFPQICWSSSLPHLTYWHQQLVFSSQKPKGNHKLPSLLHVIYAYVTQWPSHLCSAFEWTLGSGNTTCLPISNSSFLGIRETTFPSQF